MKTSKLLENCIMLHMLMVFDCDAVERQKSYMIGSLKKPHYMTIQKHVSHCEKMNGYIALLSMPQDSTLAVSPRRGTYHSTTPH